MAAPVTPLEEFESRSNEMRTRVEMLVMQVQAEFCRALEKEEEEKEGCHKRHRFTVDKWRREEGGGGITCVLQDGDVFEKAGVNVSVVSGHLPAAAVAQMRSRGRRLMGGEGGLPFFAAGVSAVIHPRNPHVPTVHFNYRYFEVGTSPSVSTER